MKRFLLPIFACVAIFAMTSCNNDDGVDTSWLVGTWQVTEMTRHYEGETEVLNFENRTDWVVGTLSFTTDGKANVLIDFNSEETDNEDIIKEYNYTAGKTTLKVGNYDLTYKHRGETLVITGQGKFIVETFVGVDVSQVDPEQWAKTQVVFTFKKL